MYIFLTAHALASSAQNTDADEAIRTPTSAQPGQMGFTNNTAHAHTHTKKRLKETVLLNFIVATHER